MWKAIILCIAIMDLTVIGKVSYKGYKLLSIVPKTNAELEFLKRLQNRNMAEYNFWLAPTFLNKEVHIMVAPHKLKEFYEIMNNFNSTFEVRIDNIQKLIDTTSNNTTSESIEKL